MVDQGWLYDVLRWAGVSQPDAAHWQEVVIKPVTVIVILLVAVVIARLGSPDHPALDRGGRPQGRGPGGLPPGQPGPSP